MTRLEFEENVRTLVVEGFELHSAIQAFLMVRKKSKKIETLTLSYKDYSPHSFYVDGVSVDIRFNEVEDPIGVLLDKHNIENRYGDTTVQRSLHNTEGVDYSFRDIEIRDFQDFDLVAKELSKIISQGALPFFDRYRNIKEVAEDLVKMSEENVSQFVSGIVGIKVPFIKKIARSSDFFNDLKLRSVFYSSEVFKYPQYFKDHEKVFGELFHGDLKVS